jgi:hypothetical protein
MRATTQSIGNNKPAAVQSRVAVAPPKGAQSSKGKEAESGKETTNDRIKPRLTMLQVIVQGINMIIDKDKPDRRVKASLEDMLKFIRDVGEKENKQAESVLAQPEVSTLHKAIKQDLSRMYDALTKQIDGVLATMSITLENTEKALADTQSLKEVTEEISTKVGRVNDAADKIASDTQTYQDVLAQSPAMAGKSALDPKVLGDMECRACQILIDIYNEDNNNTLAKSLTDLVAKANETIGKIADTDKLDKVVVETALQTQKGGLVMTLNSKEAANWLRQLEHKIAFTEGFSKGSHIRERTYNLIMPRVPIIFEPGNESHLRELEEINSLPDCVIHKARWIKPIERRRAGQIYAFVILSIASAEHANLLIRDSLNICGARVRPTKQKAEPIQCMKCRNWGHFAGECPAREDTCGTCGGKHHTNTCQNRENL